MEADSFVVRFLRLERLNTGSFMTLELPYPMDSGEEADDYVLSTLPGWEIIASATHNPDDSIYL